jgi:hypothetical protein
MATIQGALTDGDGIGATGIPTAHGAEWFT